MNDTTSSSNIPFFSVCQYITTFSIFFTNIDLMNVDQQNQTVPVINTLFQYLNKSTNESEAKYQLLLKVLKEFNIEEKNITLDLKYVNATYQFIFNESLFHHYGNSYVTEIVNKGKGNFPFFKDIVPHLSHMRIHNCSENYGSTKLNPLALGKLLKDYIWPIHRKKRISNDTSKMGMGIMNRWAKTGLPLKEKFQVINDNRVRRSPLRVKPYRRDSTSKFMDLVNFIVFDNLTNVSEHFINSLNDSEILQKNSSEFMNADKNIDMKFETSLKPLESVENSRQDLIVSKIIGKRKLDYDDIPGTSEEAQSRYHASKKKKFEWDLYESRLIGDNGKSKRMQAIENAAYIMHSCTANVTTADLVNILKGYLLRLDINASPVLSYHQFALDFCSDLNVHEKYDRWRIPSHKFIDDVLYETDFKYKNNIVPFKESFYPFFKNYNFQLKESAFMMYENSPLLQKSLRIEDFLILSHHFQDHHKRKKTIVKRVKAAIYRLAIREAEEDWVDHEIEFYCVDHEKDVDNVKRNLFLGRIYKFNNLPVLGTNLTKIEVTLINHRSSFPQSILFTLKMSNQVGVVNIDRLFNDRSTGRYIIPPDMSFIVENVEVREIGKRNIFGMTLGDKRTKEEKIIFMVDELYSIFQTTSKYEFDYYN